MQVASNRCAVCIYCQHTSSGYLTMGCAGAVCQLLISVSKRWMSVYVALLKFSDRGKLKYVGRRGVLCVCVWRGGDLLQCNLLHQIPHGRPWDRCWVSWNLFYLVPQFLFLCLFWCLFLLFLWISFVFFPFPLFPALIVLTYATVRRLSKSVKGWRMFLLL